MNDRILGIDYGSVRVGLALSDPLGLIATGIGHIYRKNRDMESVAAEIADLCARENVSQIVLGLPGRTDGKTGEKELEVREFAGILAEKTGLTPELFDERFTTVIAHRIMRDTEVKRHKKRDIVDQVAAEILLSDYLERRRSQQPARESDGQIP